MAALMVTRNCCTSGNCATCIAQPNHTYGNPVRVCQYLTWLQETADTVAANWKSYGVSIQEATEENIASLESGSAAWVREKLSNPGRIK